MNKKIILICSIIILLPVVYFFSNKKEIVPSTQTTSTNTSAWKTYSNTKYGFEFKYPENVGVVNEEDGSYAGPPTNPEEDMLLIADKEKTFHFQINNGILHIVKNSPLGDVVLSTLKFTK
jgi:hypothetical protein